MSVEEAANSSLPPPSNIPPLLSHSPPPTSSLSHNVSPSDSIIEDTSPNLYDAIQVEPVRSLNDVDPTDEYYDLPEVPGSFLFEKPPLAVEQLPLINEPGSFATDWDPFNIKPNEMSLVESNDQSKNSPPFDADWASFGATTEDNFASQKQSVVVEKNPVKEAQVDDDDDDEFSEFVDNTDCIEADTTIQNQNSTATVSNQQLNKVPVVLPVPQTVAINEPVLDFSEIANKLFVKSDSFFKPNTETLATDVDVNSNATWQQLKAYTSINDASISLKFKWYLSNLEGFYLESLNLDRVSAKKKPIPNFVSDTILQPVKIEQQGASAATVKTTPNTPLSNLNDSASKYTKSNSANSLQSNQSVDPNLVKNLSAAIEDIDLTYFENGKMSRPKKDKAEPGTAEPLSDKSKKNKYLNQLLKDIYPNETTENKPSNGTKSQEDILSDKKSSSSASSSSSNLNELGMQLHPQKLGEQFNIDIMQLAHPQTEREALEFASKLPNLAYMKSKTLVLPTLSTSGVQSSPPSQQQAK